MVFNRKKYRKYVELMYEGECDVFEYVEDRDPINHRIISQSEKKVNEDKIPCRLSYTAVEPTTEDVGAKTSENIRLFLSPEIKIKPNSKLVVTQEGVTTAFKSSSIPKIYQTHQEILLEEFDKWA